MEQSGRIPEREGTSIERDILFDPQGIKWDYNYEINESTYPIDDLIERNPFLSGVIEYFNKLGTKCDVDDMQEIITPEIKRCYKAKGIPFTKTIRNWLNGITPSQDQAHRSNCYDFCFALDMDTPTMVEFFLKSFQIMPFNYKNRVDAIYFYCFQRGKEYSAISDMLEKAKGFESVNDETIYTAEIARRIDEIDDDEEFMHYLKTQCYDQKHQSMTARRRILELIDENKKIAGGISDSALLLEIADYNNLIGGLSKTDFPDSFTKSFPNETEISKVRNGQKVSDDSLRKLLVLMNFYHYFKKKALQLSNEKIHFTKEAHEIQITRSLEEFCAETNNILAECGYIQLYPLNLFDWHILYCANSKDPIEVLKNFMRK